MLLEQGLGRLEGVGLAQDGQHPHADRLQEIADGVAQQAAQDRGHSADRGVEVGAFRLGQHHGRQHDVRRNGEEGAFREGDHGQRPGRVTVAGQREDPVIELAKHTGVPVEPAALAGWKRARIRR
ncbi:hypothetical protein D3C80_1528570 [compost metagenome]